MNSNWIEFMHGKLFGYYQIVTYMRNNWETSSPLLQHLDLKIIAAILHWATFILSCLEKKTFDNFCPTTKLISLFVSRSLETPMELNKITKRSKNIVEREEDVKLTFGRVGIRFVIHVLVYDTVDQALNIDISVHGGIYQSSFPL